MHKDEEEREAQGGGEGGGGGDAPGDAGEEHEEGEEVGEGRVGAVVGVFRLLVVVDGAEDFFRGEEEGRHFPDCHFKVHLGEFEDPKWGLKKDIVSYGSQAGVWYSFRLWGAFGDISFHRGDGVPSDSMGRRDSAPFEEAGHP